MHKLSCGGGKSARGPTSAVGKKMGVKFVVGCSLYGNEYEAREKAAREREAAKSGNRVEVRISRATICFC